MHIQTRKYRQKTLAEQVAESKDKWGETYGSGSYYEGCEFLYEEDPIVVDKKYCCKTMEIGLEHQHGAGYNGRIYVDIFNATINSSGQGSEYGPEIEQITHCPWCGQEIVVEIITS